jgi:SNF2 family DNA or RNA helicase
MLAGERLDHWAFDGKTIARVSVLPPGYQPGDHQLSREEFVRFYQHELPGLQSQIAVEFSPEFDRLEFVETPASVHLTLDGGLTGLNLQWNPPAASDWMPDPANPFRYTRPQPVTDAEARAAGFESQQTGYRLTSENRVGHFLANVLPVWERKWKVEYGPQFANFLRQCDRIQPTLAIKSSGENWLALDLNYKSDTGTLALSPADVQRMLQKGAAHHRQANGRIALVPSDAIENFQHVIFDCQATQSQTGLEVDRKFAPYLTEVLRDSPLRTEWQLPSEILSFPPLDLPALLRPYQRDGVNWLRHLAANGLAGILADEMGLGKTIQTLVWLASLKSKPSLIVCPTSLLANWQAEVARFTPELKTLVLHGVDRQFDDLTRYDLVITSYALLRRDMAEHQKIEWQAVVLDEAQQIKNRFSQIAQAVKGLRAKHRLVLTGTPVENSLGDLWSIFDFLMPGYLGPATEFRDRYEKQTDPATMQRLRHRLRPFVLRRTKAEVARDLPEKIEQITWCDLTGEQQSVYQSILTQGRREVFENTKESQRRLVVLTTLLRLRQACCHLGLLPGEHEWKEPSAKLATCLELIDEAVSSGHRVLVFSQFVKLLKLVETALPVPYCYLDGSTVDRASEIRRFQESDIPVFLISLRAGGTGLNLTGADTVIHLDPWWNPAVEEQATARAHRIGQRRVVNSYKLIARGSVEEKIVRLQERKKELIGQAIANDETFVRGLTGDELRELLQ